MFSLRDLRFVFCSRDLDVLRAQRIMGFLILITHKSTRAEKDDMESIAYKLGTKEASAPIAFG